MKKLIVGLFVVGGLAVGCSNATSVDLNNVPYERPDSIKVYSNIDGHPNIARVCVDGVAFYTTTRTDGLFMGRVPEWDKKCPPAGVKVPLGQ